MQPSLECSGWDVGWYRRKEDPVVTQLEEKLAAWTKFPVSHQEDVQILRYQYGQKYGAHWDVFDEKGPRAATVLVYLADKDLFGGETAFPNVRSLFAQQHSCTPGAALQSPGDLVSGR